MPAYDQDVRRISAVIGAIAKHNGDDDPRLPNLRRDLREAQLADHIRRTVDQTPPLTDEQRSRLALLLAPVRSRATG